MSKVEYMLRADEGDFWAEPARMGWESLQFLGNEGNSGMLQLLQKLCPPNEPASAADWRAALWAGRMAALAGALELRRHAADEGDDGLPARLVARLLALVESSHLPAPERAQAGDALAALGDPRFLAERWHLPASDDWGFVEIPAGGFCMGTAEADFDRAMEMVGAARLIQSDDKFWRDYFEAEKYTGDNTVRLDAFCMARYAVTVAQFRAYAEATKRSGDFAQALTGSETHPVREVTWHDAIAYSEWLTERLRESPAAARFDALFPSGWRATLPSEAEWERAARGPREGNPNPQRIFAWAEHLVDGERANWAETKIGTVSAVGCFPLGASPAGCLDMIGNVWEWTRSAYMPYPYQPGGERDDTAAKADRRVLRGGAFNLSQLDARCAYRFWDRPVDRYTSFGFRVCASPLSH